MNSAPQMLGPRRGATSRQTNFVTRGGLDVTRREHSESYAQGVDHLRLALDSQRGVLLTSSFEYPGRYTRWDLGFVNPPLVIEGRAREIVLRALNGRGELLLQEAGRALAKCDAIAKMSGADRTIELTVAQPDRWFAEEYRSKQASVFSVLRSLIDHFHSREDSTLGLYGAFGYELAFQFESPRLRQTRDPKQRDIVLYLPDEIVVVDHRREIATRVEYDFQTTTGSTADLPRGGEAIPYVPASLVERECDHEPGEYAATVRDAIEHFKLGELFEVVPSQTFFEPCPNPPSTVFQRLKARNPAPYGALLNLGEGEYLVAASPEMYVRSDGERLETAPISGTIRRGANAIEDAANILELLSSTKETSELTMCTDVDRNDKSRVCDPDSICVIGRRQIEMYSRLIHTVDHVEGKLRPGFDALDGFLAHTWAVTVTGAPKQHAIQFIEDHEKSRRTWYGGAIGMLGFDGQINTGLTLRTVRIERGVAEIRAGATLLFGSDPDAEEAETRLKAAALVDALRRADGNQQAGQASQLAPDSLEPQPGSGVRVLMVDHEDSFVHTLAGYFRRTGAKVETFRSGFDLARLDAYQPSLVLLSPGPGRPADFALHRTIEHCLERRIPLFGVCLGLQGIVEYFGGTLALLDEPMHGKESQVVVTGGRLFDGLPQRFSGGRYHSLYADRSTLPEELTITAETTDGIVMGLEHRSLPVAAVQFHPESIMSLSQDCGMRLVSNAVQVLVHDSSRAQLQARASAQTGTSTQR